MGELLTTGDLLADGYTHHTIKRAIERGLLHRVMRGVYAKQPAGRLDQLAALALRHPRIVFSGRTACELFIGRREIRTPYSARIDRCFGRGFEIPGVVVVKPGRRLAREHVNGLPVTSALRAAVDAHQDYPWLALDVLEQKYAGPEGAQKLADDLATYPRVPATFRELVEGAAVGGDSNTERRLFRSLRSAGLQVEQNAKIGPYRFDGLIRRARLIIEVDSFDYHGVDIETRHSVLGREEIIKNFTKDRWKQNLAVRSGYKVLRYTVNCVDDQHEEVVTQILAEVHGEVIAEYERTGVWIWHEVYTDERFWRERGGRP